MPTIIKSSGKKKKLKTTGAQVVFFFFTVAYFCQGREKTKLIWGSKQEAKKMMSALDFGLAGHLEI